MTQTINTPEGNVHVEPLKKLRLMDVRVLVIGPNVWGRGATLAEAMAKASKPKTYQVYLVHEKTQIDEMGNFVYPTGFPPVRIDEKKGRKRGTKASSDRQT